MARQLHISSGIYVACELGKRLPTPGMIKGFCRLSEWDDYEAQKKLYQEMVADFEKRTRKKLKL